MEVRLQQLALRDLKAGVRFYDKQEAGLGRYFATTMWTEINALAHTAGIHARIEGGFHRYVSHVFPYAVYYRVEAELVRVYAVYDCRRNPAKLRRRLGSA